MNSVSATVIVQFTGKANESTTELIMNGFFQLCSEIAFFLVCCLVFYQKQEIFENNDIQTNADSFCYKQSKFIQFDFLVFDWLFRRICCLSQLMNHQT